MARRQNGRTDICRDFLGAKMAEPSFAENAKCTAEPNRTEIAEICYQAIGGGGGVLGGERIRAWYNAVYPAPTLGPLSRERPPEWFSKCNICGGTPTTILTPFLHRE